MYTLALQKGLGEKDFSAIYELLNGVVTTLVVISAAVND